MRDLTDYIQCIAKKECYTLDNDAAKLIAKAAQGSARDALSMLDQALLTSEEQKITTKSIATMLGIVDIESMYKIFSFISKGAIIDVLDIIRDLYNKGAESSLILQELMDITHKVTLCKVGDAKDIIISDYEIKNCKALSKKLSVVVLSRYWQMFNKAFIDMKTAHNDFHALEMTLIKVAYANLSISPEDILKELSNVPSDTKHPHPQEVKKNLSDCATIEDLFNILEDNMEMMLCNALKHDMSIIEFRKGYIKIENTATKKYNKQDIKRRLNEVTGIAWVIEDSNSESGINYGEKEGKNIKGMEDAIKQNDLVQDVLKSFSGTEISDIKLNN
jgi:DNA polymerase-3 subunit gamma/tau